MRRALALPQFGDTYDGAKMRRLVEEVERLARTNASSSSTAWADLTGKPTTFPPSSHTHAASDITSGVIDPARLGTGERSTLVFLRGDGTWAGIPGGGGVTDHGGLSGLLDDDHPQYLNQSRGDARYRRLSVAVPWADLSGLPAFATRWPTWAEVTGKPTEFTPAAHTHGLADLTDFGAAGGYIRSTGTAWARVSGVAWADLTSIPSFASRWPTWSEVTDKPTSFTPAAHVLATTSGLGAEHTVSGLTAGQVLRATGATTAAFRSLIAADIPSLGAGKIKTGTFANARISQASVTQHQAALSIAWSQLTSVPSTFTPSAHTHAIADVTGLQSALDGKAASSHTHSYLPLSGGTMTGAIDFISTTIGDLNSVDSPYAGARIFSTPYQASNRPAANYASGIEWQHAVPGGYRSQFAMDTSGTTPRAFIRNMSNGVWGSWFELSKSSHTHSYLPLSGGALIGTLTARTVYVQSGYGIELGNASDTTLTRKAAGLMGVENRAVVTHASTSYTSAEITFSTGNPSGGASGDIWFKYT